ncbi:hypothetical protein [Gemmatimonas aurantiaca]|uniref:hypothetical protein n=1 Tax=Gemmatimonas aurantiaca TaxID=173480 RepID=UPI00301D9FA1
MTIADVLILDPDLGARNAVKQTLAGLHYHPIATGSFDEAVRRAEAGDLEVVIADWRALVGPSTVTSEPFRLAIQLRTSLARLRAVHARSPHVSEEGRSSSLGIIVTASVPDAATHAAAISAGADAYLRPEDLQDSNVLGSYLTRLLEQLWAGTLVVPGHAAAVVPGSDGTPSDVAEGGTSDAEMGAQRATDMFELPDGDLRDDISGRWDASKIARALGRPLTEIARALGVNYSTVHKTPDSPALQERLAPFANVFAMVRDIYGKDDTRARKWLLLPQAKLGNTSALAAMCVPGQATAVEQWVAGLWLGEGE